MVRRYRRLKKLCVALSYGAITLGVLQAYSLVNFSDIAISILTVLLSALVTILFGGQSPFQTA
jgi:hypothetical protein